MDRKLVLNAQLALPRGHRIEVTERVDEHTGDTTVFSLVDLDTGVRYRRAEELRGDVLRWSGRVLDCTISLGAPTLRTVITVDADGDGGAGTGARTALHGADAAAEAAKAEADRWGGGDREPEPEPERFW
ncbi:hypothetical protein [Microbacterium sp.]|uniref:hypothetical protein n=1 Tax=Microbacterium sp. TaxID=51671 RepID=UPI0035657B58